MLAQSNSCIKVNTKLLADSLKLSIRMAEERQQRVEDDPCHLPLAEDIQDLEMEATKGQL